MSKSKGNVVVPDRHPRQVRRRRRPLAGGDGPPRPGLAVRRDPDEGRPPAGDEGAQRLASSCSAASARPRSTRPRSPSRSTGRCSAGWRSVVTTRDRGVRRLRLHHRARGRPRGSSGSSATTTSSWSRSGRTTTTAAPATALGQGHAGAGAARPAAAARAVPALRRPRRSGRGGRRARSTSPSWPTAAELGAAAAADPALLDAVAAALTGIRGAKSQAKVSMRAELSRVEITGTARRWWRRSQAAAADLRTAGKITGELVARATSTTRRCRRARAQRDLPGR